MPGRTFGSGLYRYGFNGKEMDNEVKGTGNQQDYGFRIYDPRIGKFLSVDPLTKNYPWYTPYQFAGNSPIQSVDVDGLEPASVSILRSISSSSGKIVAGSSSANYSATSHMVSVANGIAVDPAGNVLAFTSRGGLAHTLDFSQGGASSDISANFSLGVSLYNDKAPNLPSLLGTGKSAGVGVGLDKFGVGFGASFSAELSDNYEMVGATLQVSFGFGAGTPLVMSGQESSVTGVVFAKAEYDRVYNMKNVITSQLQDEIANYNLNQATNANGSVNYGKALWQADGGTVNVGYEKVGENRFEIVINSSYRQYAQQTSIPPNSNFGSYKDNIVRRSTRTGVFLNADTDGNYISEAYQRQ